MKYAHLDFAGDIARVTLDHPTGNRINFAMRAELLETFERIDDSPAKVVLVRAEGADFCLGGDVREWPGIPAHELRPRIEVFAKALERLEALKIPSIAAVHGGCMGGGFELALSCDFIVAARSARFAFPEARVGIMTLQGGVVQLAERIGWVAIFYFGISEFRLTAR
jgi:enoyl-CoA hydratase/carnithine racemase